MIRFLRTLIYSLLYGVLAIPRLWLRILLGGSALVFFPCCFFLGAIQKLDHRVERWSMLPILLMLASPAFACQSIDGLPDAACTPGATDPAVRQENIHQTICVPGYSATVRNVPQSIKNVVYKEYSIISHAPGEYEIDHLDALCLGGANDIKNLWPQPYRATVNAHQKDELEDRLHELVCKGTISLDEAQHAIQDNWIDGYKKYVCGNQRKPSDLCHED